MATYGHMSKATAWRVYILAEEGNEFCKIGSAANPKYRIDQLQAGNPRRIRMVSAWRLCNRDAALAVESLALKNAGLLRLDRRDWLQCTPEAAIAFVRSALAHLDAKEAQQDG